MCLAPGLVAFSTVNILARAFFALGDTKTPMKISIVCLGESSFLSAACWSCRCGRAGLASPTPSPRFATPACCFSRCGKTGETGNGTVARNRFCRWRSPACWPALMAWSGWRFWENSLGHADHRAENWRGVCAGGYRRAGLLAAGAGFQNSGGEGDDGIRAGEIQAAVGQTTVGLTCRSAGVRGARPAPNPQKLAASLVLPRRTGRCAPPAKVPPSPASRVRQIAI